MQSNQNDNYRLGRLPHMAPLANPYVPFQEENSPKYDARFGLVRGTLYPGLDLPFMGMVNQKELPQRPIHDLQAMDFALNELALYLDTHPEDEEALNLYRQYQTMLAEGNQKFSTEQRPMTHQMQVQHKHYSWLDDPWPWEYGENKEV